ncbi:uncharacterized protein K460DRAFT_426644 [Cucurbitaria berberidis CBS 394.84]|uniref:Uncharacterized protein n=1 Tax=Cucurbitaria berberidis CBS 394.84 TaxID=1168544 RepID=A0A9P4LAX8_9PLEO|nr:uncharacterized protein K460DRAFT_426644 [Cucurbitaria berberidis CBS 394.84]KAF1847822.1 hypothetical protein K460DRAFT_426644 [Cucurbitaria berberidis CBS 394.84]
MFAPFDRFAAIPGLLVTSSICYTVLGAHIAGYRGSEALVQWTESNRTLVTVMVQLLSYMLALVHIHAICALFRSYWLLSISSKHFRLYNAHFIQAVTSPRMTWDLSWKLTLLVMMVVLASMTPAPLWAAAISPHPAQRDVKSWIKIPTFNIRNTSALWDGELSTTFAGTTGQWLVDQGLFSFDLNNFRGALQDSARAASVLTDGTIRHAKLDKTGFVYEGRSYGSGSGAGFTEIPDVKAPDSYQYFEQGLRTDVVCFYNDSIIAAFVEVTDKDQPINLWQTTGLVATGARAGFNTFAVWLPEDLFAWNHVYNKPERKIQLQLMTGASPTNKTQDQHTFGQFTNIQCDITFKGHMFQVNVNNTGKIIRSELLKGSLSDWPTHGDVVATRIDTYFNDLTFGDSCSGGCQLGIALVTNINQLSNQMGRKGNATMLRGTQDYFASLVDNLLVNLHLTRWASGAPEPTESVPASVTVPALVFGDKKFIWIICVLNLVILCAYLCELIRTRAWAATPPFDIMNDSEVIIAAFEGGRMFEKSLVDAALYSSSRQRISDNTMLNLQFEGLARKRPVLTPHSTDDGITPVSDEEGLLGNVFIPSLESFPLAEIRRR